MTLDQKRKAEVAVATAGSRRDLALSPLLLARSFHQPALIYFEAVAETLSVRACARRLNVASSAVSRQIAQLEAALGMELFHREGRTLKLTAAGEILFRHVRRIAAPIEAAVSELDMLRGLKTGTVRVATVESIGLSVLPPLLGDFACRFPRLYVDVTVTSAAEVIACLDEEKVDVGFGFLTQPSPRVEMVARRDMRLGVLMRPDHPLAALPHVTLLDCSRHAVAIGKRNLSIREAIEPILASRSFPKSPMLEVGSIRMLVELAQVGHHVSIMTAVGAHSEIRSGALVFRPLADPQLPLNRFGLMVRANAVLHFAPAVFYEHAKEHLRTVELPGAAGWQGEE